jgi:hypothetical protein
MRKVSSNGAGAPLATVHPLMDQVRFVKDVLDRVQAHWGFEPLPIGTEGALRDVLILTGTALPEFFHERVAVIYRKNNGRMFVSLAQDAFRADDAVKVVCGDFIEVIPTEIFPHGVNKGVSLFYRDDRTCPKGLLVHVQRGNAWINHARPTLLPL